MQRICVFAGAYVGATPAHAACARQLGDLLAARGLGVVYGGGCVGLMGHLAEAALARGGEVIGVIPEAIVALEVAHRGLTRLEVVDTMHTRKARMAELADAFIVLPGGIGTLEEMFEIWAWGKLALHRKPLGVLNSAGYFDRLLGFLDEMAAEGFLKAEHRAMLAVATAPDALLDRLAAYVPPTVSPVDPAAFVTRARCAP